MAGAAAWCLAGFFSLFTRGGGSTLSGYELADLSLSGQVGGLVDPWVGVLMFGLPALGAGVVICEAGAGVRALGVRSVLAVLGGAASLAVASEVAGGDPETLGGGAWLALAGATCVAAGTVWGWLRR